uniref:Uncharacterized protein n=1 Tax=Ursus maritimus TaxID=29073 RepID=A0A452TKT2_URSMA
MDSSVVSGGASGNLAPCLSFAVTAVTHAAPMALQPGGRHTAAIRHTKKVKDHNQKWLQEQAQSLRDKTTSAFQQEKIPPTPFSVPPPRGNGPTSPQSLRGLLALVGWQHPIWGGPPMMIGPPSPDMKPAGPAPGMRPPVGGHMPMTPTPPVMRPPACAMRVPSRPGMTRPDKDGREPLYMHFILFVLHQEIMVP